MPKRKSVKLETIDDLVNHIETANETLKDEISGVLNEGDPQHGNPSTTQADEVMHKKKR